MIEFKDVRFAYPKSGFSLEIDQLSVLDGQQVCWVGPSGCGKTTLLHLAAGIYAANEGAVRTCGVELTELGDAGRRDFRIANLGLVFQDFALLDYLSVLDNILLPYRISRALRLDNEMRKRSIKVATEVGIDALLGRTTSELSQGERQRVAICRAIVTRPKILLADEPTANLDSDTAARVLCALQSYAEKHGSALVIVSHDHDTISRFDVKTDVSIFRTQTCLDAAGGLDG